jgi:hypothetical protein
MSIKISQLPSAVSIIEEAVFPIVQNETTEKATIRQLLEFISGGPILVYQVTASSAGPFTIAHTLGAVPKAVSFTMSNAGVLGQFWLDTSLVTLGYDENNVYGISSDDGVTGQIIIFG